MELIADILLISGAIAATAYCVVLSRRLRRFTDLEKGVGGAIAVLSAQVDDMTKTLGTAQASAVGSVKSLDQLTGKAENVARRLELLVASMHDIPEPAEVDKKAADIAQSDAPEKPTNPVPDNDPETGPLFLSKRNQVKEAAE